MSATEVSKVLYSAPRGGGPAQNGSAGAGGAQGRCQRGIIICIMNSKGYLYTNHGRREAAQARNKGSRELGADAARL
jgi:hypothetical protein